MNKDWLDIDVLEDYLDGKLDGKAMHFVEKQALEDPFIADALEGLRQSPKRKQNFSILQKKLHDRIAQKPVKRKLWGITTQRMSIAAAATVIFLSVSILFFMRENNRKNVETAQRKSKCVIVNLDSNNALAANKPELKNADSKTIASEKNALIDKAIEDSKKDKLAVNNKKVKAPNAIVSQPTAPVINEEIVAVKSERVASVARVEQAKLSRADGNYVTAVDSNKINLNAGKDRVMSEVVAANVQLAKKKQIENAAQVSAKSASVLNGKTTTSTKPIPAVADYDKYLSLNNKLANKTGVQGKVLLSFNVNKNGRPENIKVTKSLSKEADAEAIRLIQTGPDWLMPAKGTNSVDLEVKF
ncbi:TonB family protein [Pedobacter changchengzhani]|uniref:TonB family protein n=1 Tax=Pedobacter changchengzhani TaxID=2529274 RepID=A0A4R5MNQ9_9SPHI|nr:TonB family protein [Pedobacter changchengzhani]TDG37318.1 TonB family protein [Pedobacter changchengzhani]